MLSVDECVFCGSREPSWSVGLTAPFIAEYVLDEKPRPTEFGRCSRCKGIFARERYQSDDVRRLYQDYRGAHYFEVRHRHEFWYTARVNEGFGDATAARRRGIEDALAASGLRPAFERALDFGGGDGCLFPDGRWTERVVVDPSGAAKAEGVISAHDLDEVDRSDFDLVMACQVFEHLADPSAVMAQLAQRLGPRGVLYLEVPDERFVDWTLPPGLQRAFLTGLSRAPRLLAAFDLLSVAARHKARLLPPFGFLKLHEHINFFSLEALGKLVERTGLRPSLLRRHTVVVGSQRIPILQCVAELGSGSAAQGAPS